MLATLMVVCRDSLDEFQLGRKALKLHLPAQNLISLHERLSIDRYNATHIQV